MDAATDEERPLTQRGRQVVAAISKRLQNRAQCHSIVCSPYLRAQQTAAIILADQPLLSMTTSTLITPYGRCVSVAGDLAACGASGVVLVTHQPFIGELVEYLTGKALDIQPATAVAIETDHYAEGQGRVLWVERD